MDKNYYELLQVDKNASSEIIEKAYKTLAKKYHPDLQTEENKHYAGEILKQINEAYEVLSDLEKRKSYDNSIVDNTISKEEFDNLYNENQILKNKLNYIQQTSQQTNQNFTQNRATTNDINKTRPNPYSNNNYTYEQEIQNTRQQAYYDAYIQDLKSRGYKIRYKKTSKDYFKNLLSLVLTVLILFILWQIPFVKKFLYSNEIIKTFIDIITNIFK